MAVERLDGRLNNLPLILSGPLLRRVTPTSVTVWLALKHAATVTLQVKKADGASAMPVATATTHAIGLHLHMLAITARVPESAKLVPDTTYLYDLEFAGEFGRKSFLEALGAPSNQPHPLAYFPFQLPSFALPPGDLEKLRLVHGSCRKAHGPGHDALAILDELIGTSSGHPLARPHQLLLTGDQIYADDVADPLLMLLTEIGDTLLGWAEQLPDVTPGRPPFVARVVRPRMRVMLCKDIGFTSTDMPSHLLSLGEYLAIYLLAWSETLWPRDLPSRADFEQLYPEHRSLPRAILEGFDTQRIALEAYRSTLSRVRRALANVPSYMIFDDHEITDDWYMTRGFCERVLGNPLGLRVMQNGMVAYALCQLWGNTPEQFEADAVTRVQAPGLKLLTQLAWSGDQNRKYAERSPAIRRILGVQSAQEIAERTRGGVYKVFHERGPQITVNGAILNDVSLDYHFTVEGPGHQVLVTDSRTWRSFEEDDKVSPGNLIAEGELITQVSSAMPALGNRLQLVVLTTNFPPIPSIRWAVGKFSGAPPGIRYYKDFFDSWELPSASSERLLTHLCSRLPAAEDGVKTGRIILLSGDVHSSHVSRIAYWAEQGLGDVPDHPQPVKAVLAHLVASPFKNQDKDTVGQHQVGHRYSPLPSVKPPRVAPEGVIGWNVHRLSPPIEVGQTDYQLLDDEGQPIPYSQPLKVSAQKPSRQIAQLDRHDRTSSATTTLSQRPDYRYRIDYPPAVLSGRTPPSLPTIPTGGASAAERKRAAEAYGTALMDYFEFQTTARGRELVGHNNIGEIRFRWGDGDDKHVEQILRWRIPVGEALHQATFTVSLALDHPVYKPLAFRREP
jgi:hypothetical protein